MARQAAGLALAAFLLAGCAVPSDYFGLPTRGPMSASERLVLDLALESGRLGTGDCEWWDKAADKLSRLPCEFVPTHMLAWDALSDDKQAILELAKRLEEGRGVPQDLAKAEELYEIAGTDSSSSMTYYANGQSHTFFDFGPPGLPEARQRHELLIAWRTQRDDPALAQCPVPAVDTAELAARPATPAETARRDKAIAQGQLGRGECLWRKGEKELTTIPCGVVPLPELAAMARAGDRHAMLELGIRFERGRGVARDLAQAEAFACAAGRTRIISGGEGPEGWTPLSGEIGLPEARRRWERLRKSRQTVARSK
jgi:TPR repeat protein